MTGQGQARAPGVAGHPRPSKSLVGIDRAVGSVMGRYHILDEIAAGGMATVHLARVEGGADDGMFVAVKRMHAHFAQDGDFSSMFLDEAMVCTHIRHPNVVPTIDVVQEGEELLLVLELVDGEALSKLVKQLGARKARVPQPIISAVVADMLRGLHGAHEATNEAGEPLMIVHRDVSPHNVMVGSDGVAQVLDFGVAKARGRIQQTQKGQLKGKLAYMSPEQARGKPVDRRSDVFAAGIVLWELLCGRRLFDADNEGALLVKLLTERPAPLSAKDPSLARFDDLVARALRVEPDERYATALEMAESVERAIPRASAAEVSTWVRTEAKLALSRREAMIAKAKAKFGARDSSPTHVGEEPTTATPMPARRLPAPTPPPSRDARAVAAGPGPSGPAELWDTSTTTDDRPGPPGHSPAAPPGLTPKPGGTLRPPSAAGGPAAQGPAIPSQSPPTTLLVPAAPTAMTPSHPFVAAAAFAPTALPPGRGSGELGAAPTVQAAHRGSHAAISSQAPWQTAAPSERHPSFHHGPASMSSPGGAVLTPAPSSPRSARFGAEPPSHVTSANMTTTEMPPPLAPEQVRRLTLISAATAILTMVAAAAVLFILSRRASAELEASKPITVPTSTAEAASAAGAPGPATSEPATSSSPEASASAAVSAVPSPVPRPTATQPTGGWPASRGGFLTATKPPPKPKPKR